MNAEAIKKNETVTAKECIKTLQRRFRKT